MAGSPWDTGAVRVLERILAVVGALCLLILVALGVVLLSFGVAAGDHDGGASAPVAGPAPPADGGDGLWFERVDGPAGELRDVRVRARGARLGAGTLSAQRLDVDATVPYESVAARIGPGARVSPAGPQRIAVSVRREVLGRPVEVSGVAAIRAEGGRIALEPVRIDVPGPPGTSEALADVVGGLGPRRLPVPGLPPGLALTHVTVVDAGLRVSLAGSPVTLALPPS